ncbi:hypothetical protein BaRGS_00034238, partial [Batillaria attramentaria]
LGKTIQVIAFLSGLFDMEKVKHALIVVPVSVMVNWEKEFNKWAPGITVTAFHGKSKRERERSLDRVRRRGGVLLTTYGMVVTSWEQLAHDDNREFVWDYVILDEGHKIKNPTKTTKGIHAVGAHHRIILTGTPLQNNLKELWTLFDYVHQGSLLGTLRTFKQEFENPIIRARERDATGGEKRLGLEMAESLKKIIAPFFLRRTKAEVKDKENQEGKEGSGPHKSVKMPTMMYKNDFVVWLFLSETQLKIYQDFLQLDSVKELLTSSQSPLVALTVLKKICDHPRLLSLRACHQLGLHGHEMDEDELELPSSYESAVTKVEQLPDEVLVGEAGKMAFLLSLLNQLREDGHRCLIFSQSRKMLDIIQKVLRNHGHKVNRLDGTMSIAEREDRVQKFQRDGSYTVFLLTTQVGGVGLTLTAADRVVIYDPSWNPATDAQAVDRAFRIGQTRNVVVYRLITCGTVEEKIYRRQIFKDSITRQTTGGTKDPYRYFTRQELRELFQLDEPRFSTTQQQLEEMHGLDRRRDPELDSHIAFLHSLDIFGISDHDLMFSQESQPEEEQEIEAAPHVDQHADEYIKHRVQKAKEIIERESSVPGTMEQRFSTAFQYPPMSVYAAPENRALMKGVGMGNQSVMMSRPGGQPNVFRVEIQKPKMPAKPEVKPAVTTSHSSESDVVDLTEDDDEETILPVIEKKVKQEREPVERAVKETPPTPEDTAVAEIRRLSIKEENNSKTSAVSSDSKGNQNRGMGQEGSFSETVKGFKEETTKSAEPPEEPTFKSPPVCRVDDDQKRKAEPGGPTTPMKVTPNQQRVIEEELIISPNAYTPLMHTRQKRRRVTNSPAIALERSLAFGRTDTPPAASGKLVVNDGGDSTTLVADSPDIQGKGSTSSESPSSTSRHSHRGEKLLNSATGELQSFLNEEDQSLIEESFVGDDDQDADVDSPPITGNIDNSDEDQGDLDNRGTAYDGYHLKPDGDDEEVENEAADEEEGNENNNADYEEEVDDEDADEDGDIDEVGSEEEADEDGDTDDVGDEDGEVNEASSDAEDEQNHSVVVSLYKQKRYREAKKCVDEALDIVPDPQLISMAEKIQSKIDAGL